MSTPGAPAAPRPAPPPDAPRYAVRRRLPDGTVGDIVGHLVARTDGTRVVLPDDRPAETVLDRDVIACREVPARVVRPTSSAADLERLCARGWPGLEQKRLGGWLLRAGLGWSGRANSCLAVGDPGCDVQEAVDAVARFYSERSLTPALHVVDDLDAAAVGGGRSPRGRRATPDAERALRDLVAATAAGEVVQLAGRAWSVEQPTLVLVADLRAFGALHPGVNPAAPLVDPRGAPTTPTHLDAASNGSHPTAPRTRGPDLDGALAADRVVVCESDAPDDRWWGVYRAGSVARDDAAHAVVTATPARYLTAHLDDRAVWCARLTFTADWAGLSCVEVVPTHRRAGLGASITRAALSGARRHGARFAYVQVEQDNGVALRLYERLGFRRHHAYRYLRATR